MSVLKSLFAYAGRHKYLTMLSLLFSLISAVFLLMPFSTSMKKGFGSLTYDTSLSDTFDGKYNIVGNQGSIDKSI